MQHSGGTYFTFFVIFGLVGMLFVMTAFMLASEPTGIVENIFVVVGGTFGLLSGLLSVIHLLNLYFYLFDHFWHGNNKLK